MEHYFLGRTGLAFDRASGNVYVSAVVGRTMSGRDRSAIVVVSPATASHKRVVQGSTLYTDVAVDPSSAWMFWTEHDKQQVLKTQHSHASGTDRTDGPMLLSSSE